MSAAFRSKLLSFEEYFAGESDSATKHEYLGGAVYAMPEGTNAHNIVATNLIAILHAELRASAHAKGCRPFNSDTKIRIRSSSHTRFYYPDASVVCQPNPQQDSFQDHPAIIFEVLSDRTRRADEGEKKDAYLNIASLDVYVLVEQSQPSVVVFRRGEHGFVRESHNGLNSSLPLPEIGIELSLARIYESIEFAAESSEEVG